MVEIVRYQGRSSDGIDTHEWKSYRKEFRYAERWTDRLEGEIVDPFARNCGWGTLTNDINPNFHTDFHMDAANFLELHEDKKAKLILFDPPFSDRQARDKYDLEDTNLYAAGDGRMKRCGNSMMKMLVPGGVILKLGYNSNCPIPPLDPDNPMPQLKLVRIAIVAFGGLRNDVIMSHWLNPNTSLYDFERTEFMGEDGVIVQ